MAQLIAPRFLCEKIPWQILLNLYVVLLRKSGENEVKEEIVFDYVTLIHIKSINVKLLSHASR